MSEDDRKSISARLAARKALQSIAAEEAAQSQIESSIGYVKEGEDGNKFLPALELNNKWIRQRPKFRYAGGRASKYWNLQGLTHGVSKVDTSEITTPGVQNYLATKEQLDFLEQNWRELVRVNADVEERLKTFEDDIAFLEEAKANELLEDEGEEALKMQQRRMKTRDDFTKIMAKSKAAVEELIQKHGEQSIHLNSDIRYIINWFDLLLDQKASLDDAMVIHTGEEAGKAVGEGIDFQALLTENLESMYVRLQKHKEGTEAFVHQLEQALLDSKRKYDMDTQEMVLLRVHLQESQVTIDRLGKELKLFMKQLADSEERAYVLEQKLKKRMEMEVEYRGTHEQTMEQMRTQLIAEKAEHSKAVVDLKQQLTISKDPMLRASSENTSATAKEVAQLRQILAKERKKGEVERQKLQDQIRSLTIDIQTNEKISSKHRARLQQEMSEKHGKENRAASKHHQEILRAAEKEHARQLKDMIQQHQTQIESQTTALETALKGNNAHLGVMFERIKKEYEAKMAAMQKHSELQGKGEDGETKEPAKDDVATRLETENKLAAQKQEFNARIQRMVEEFEFKMKMTGERMDTQNAKFQHETGQREVTIGNLNDRIGHLSATIEMLKLQNSVYEQSFDEKARTYSKQEDEASADPSTPQPEAGAKPKEKGMGRDAYIKKIMGLKKEITDYVRAHDDIGKLLERNKLEMNKLREEHERVTEQTTRESTRRLDAAYQRIADLEQQLSRLSGDQAALKNALAPPDDYQSPGLSTFRSVVKRVASGNTGGSSMNLFQVANMATAEKLRLLKDSFGSPAAKNDDSASLSPMSASDPGKFSLLRKGKSEGIFTLLERWKTEGSAGQSSASDSPAPASPAAPGPAPEPAKPETPPAAPKQSTEEPKGTGAASSEGASGATSDATPAPRPKIKRSASMRVPRGSGGNKSPRGGGRGTQRKSVVGGRARGLLAEALAESDGDEDKLETSVDRIVREEREQRTSLLSHMADGKMQQESATADAELTAANTRLQQMLNLAQLELQQTRRELQERAALSEVSAEPASDGSNPRMDELMKMLQRAYEDLNTAQQELEITRTEMANQHIAHMEEQRALEERRHSGAGSPSQLTLLASIANAPSTGHEGRLIRSSSELGCSDGVVDADEFDHRGVPHMAGVAMGVAVEDDAAHPWRRHGRYAPGTSGTLSAGETSPEKAAKKRQGSAKRRKPRKPPPTTESGIPDRLASEDYGLRKGAGRKMAQPPSSETSDDELVAAVSADDLAARTRQRFGAASLAQKNILQFERQQMLRAAKMGVRPTPNFHPAVTALQPSTEPLHPVDKIGTSVSRLVAARQDYWRKKHAAAAEEARAKEERLRKAKVAAQFRKAEQKAKLLAIQAQLEELDVKHTPTRSKVLKRMQLRHEMAVSLWERRKIEIEQERRRNFEGVLKAVSIYAQREADAIQYIHAGILPYRYFSLFGATGTAPPPSAQGPPVQAQYDTDDGPSMLVTGIWPRPQSRVPPMWSSTAQPHQLFTVPDRPATASLATPRSGRRRRLNPLPYVHAKVYSVHGTNAPHLKRGPWLPHAPPQRHDASPRIRRPHTARARLEDRPVHTLIDGPYIRAPEFASHQDGDLLTPGSDLGGRQWGGSENLSRASPPPVDPEDEERDQFMQSGRSARSVRFADDAG